MADKQIRIEIIGDASSLRRALSGASQSFQGTIGQWAKGALVFDAVHQGINLVGDVLRTGAQEWSQSTKVAAQTGAVLKSTGGIANVTAKQVDALSTALMKQSGIDDEVIKTGENMLLTFTTIRNEVGKGNDVFDQATKAVLDMDVAMSHGNSTQESLSKTAILVGKALNDPIKGATALRRVGVQLTDAQEKQIKAFIKSGDVMSAQKVILGELTKEFGGSAKAIGDTLPGQLNKVREGFRNLSAHLVTSLLPTFERVVAWTTDHWPEIEATFKAVFQAIGAVIRAGVATVQAIIPVVQAVVDWVKQNWPQISSTFMSVFNTVKAIVQGAVTAILVIWNTFGVQILSQLRATWTFVQSYIQGVLNVIRGIFNVFGGLLHGDWSRVWMGLQQIFSGIATQILAVVRLFGTTIVNLLTGAGKLMLAAVQGPWNAIKALAVSTFNGVVSAITGAISTATTAAAAVGKGIVTGIGNGLTAIIGVVKGGLDKIWGIISNVAGLALNAAKAIGSGIIEGIVSGLTGLAGRVGGAIADGAKGAVDKSLHFLRIRSPSGYTRDMIGIPLGEGIVLGVTDGLKLLGASLVRAITASLGTAKTIAVKGMNDVGKLIVAAAKKYGVDARAALAVAMGEGGIKFGAVGDSGHAFGPFQFNNAGGVATGKSAAEASAWANSARGVADAIRMMADAGARGKTGLDAITAIVRNFERPLDPSGSIRKAAEAYRTLGPQIGAAIKSGAGAVTTSQRTVLTGLVNLAKQYGPIIGIEQVRAIIRGLDASQPGFLAKARESLAAFTAAARQKVVESTATFASAFNGLANAALQAFDTRWAAWVPPAQRLLDKMNLAEQVKQVQDQLATAMTAISGGGVFDASVLSKQLGESLAGAMSQALGSIAGAKTEEALNRVAAQVQTQVLAAIDQTAATATTQAQAAVDAARTALTAAQAGGDPDAIAAAQAALDTAVNNQKALEAAILAEKELALGQLAAAETKRHEAIGAIQREGLAKQLAELKAFLVHHPEEWGKMGASVNAILGSYNTKLQNAGHAWADKFGEGVRAGIPAAVAAARALAAAVAAVMPSTSSPLKPAKKGPLSFHPRTMGKAWATALGAGLASGGLSGIMDSMVPSSLSFGGGIVPAGRNGMVAAGAGGGVVVNVNVSGALLGTSVPEVAETIRRELYRTGNRNAGLAFN